KCRSCHAMVPDGTPAGGQLAKATAASPSTNSTANRPTFQLRCVYMVEPPSDIGEPLGNLVIRTQGGTPNPQVETFAEVGSDHPSPVPIHFARQWASKRCPDRRWSQDNAWIWL